MAVINCKICGSPLPLIPNVTVVECEYCGREQTIPSMDNEKKLTLFARAERLRTACEFDKAAGVFETIVADFPEEAEAYWGLVLCKYGIEYVDDPATGGRVPTCHRSSFQSVLDDSDFEQVLENADVASRRVYREEAKRLDEIRKGIISVSASENPYDIFICYKETAENGDRTLDSVLAQDIYDQLVSKGYRVFFARVTLEDKLGQEYEPYIFAALNSAKLMLAIGTDYEYFNAVWVKNEWSRYLKLMTPGSEKHLIPCYKNIDPSDMPKEFARLQAQDLGKVGAMQDLMRGVEKILPREMAAPKPEWAKMQGDVSQNTIGAYLKRAFQFLNEETWDKADAYLEKALDIAPECAEAFMGKLMLEFRVMHEAQLGLQYRPISASKNYRKVMQYGDPGIRQRLENYNRQVEQRIATRKAQMAELEDKKQAVLAEVQRSNQIMNEHHQRFAAAEQQVKERAEQYLQAQMQKAELEQKYIKLRASSGNTAIPLWILLPIIAVCVILWLVGGSEQTSLAFICLAIGAVTLIVSGVRTSESAAAAVIVNLGLVFFVFVGALIYAFGRFELDHSFLSAIGAGVIHLPIALIGGIFGGDLGEQISAETMTMTCYISAAIYLGITLVVSVIGGIEAASTKSLVRSAKNAYEKAQKTVAAMEADSDGERQLVAAMGLAKGQYDSALKACRSNVHVANNAYLRTGERYNLKTEQLIPDLYR